MRRCIKRWARRNVPKQIRPVTVDGAIITKCGLGVIAGECKRAGLALPVTAMRWGYVVTTFKRPRIDESGSNLDQNLDHTDPDPIQIDPDVGGDIPRRLLSTLRRNPLISRKLLADELNVSERKIRDSLKILKDSGVIVRQGPDHGGIWRISHIGRNAKRNDPINTPRNEVANGPVNGSAATINGTIRRQNDTINGTINSSDGTIKQRLFGMIIQTEGQKRESLAARLSVSLRTVARLLSELEQERKIIYRGSKKIGGYYAVE